MINSVRGLMKESMDQAKKDQKKEYETVLDQELKVRVHQLLILSQKVKNLIEKDQKEEEERKK